MQIQLLPFGILKSALGNLTMELPEGATVADMVVALRAQLEPEGLDARLLSQIAVSVNAEYAQGNCVLRDGDVVGLLPPVSGGSGAEKSTTKTYLTRAEIPRERLVAEAKDGADGAVVVFDGVVRNETRGRETLYLDYEAYEEMAVRQLKTLAEQAVERFAVRSVVIVHRLGRLEIGESSVLIVVSSAHRGAAFDACRWAIDTLKKTVPIWKRETFRDGAVWADGEPFPAEIALYSEGDRAAAETSPERKP